MTKTKKLFKPNGNLMSQLSDLTKDNVKQWYKEYLDYHKGIDQGLNYLIGYFPTNRAKELRKLLKLKKYEYKPITI